MAVAVTNVEDTSQSGSPAPGCSSSSKNFWAVWKSKYRNLLSGLLSVASPGVVDDKIILNCAFILISALMRWDDSSANSCSQTSLSVGEVFKCTECLLIAQCLCLDTIFINKSNFFSKNCL